MNRIRDRGSAVATAVPERSPRLDSPRLRTRFTEAFGFQQPIVCAPMALVTGGRLARAVSDAGGLGIVGGGYAGVLGGEFDLAAELPLLRGATFGVGFITWALAQAPARLDEVLESKPAFVFLSFGDPGPFSEKILSSGAHLICQVQTLEHAREAIAAGARIIVAQGTEAGGHGGSRTTMTLVPEVRDYLERNAPDVLLLAAGGIADGRGLAAALLLGADGAVVGTRFWASEEALTSRAATDLGISASGDDTARTSAVDALRGVPWPREFSFRILKNTLSERWTGREAEAWSQFGSLARSYADARAAEDFRIAAVVAGEAVGLISDRPSAATIVDKMVADAIVRLDLAGRGDFR